MVAEAQLVCSSTLALLYLCPAAPPPPPSTEAASFDVSPAPSISNDLSRRGSAFSCSTSIQTNTSFETTKKFTPRIRSGSHTDIGPRRSNEDQHICVDNLCSHLQSRCSWPEPSSFYAVFDGHGGSDAAVYMTNNAMKIFFEDAKLPQISDIDEKFLQDLEVCHRSSFILADQALADKHSLIDSYCGTTALTALVIGRNLLIANAGDSRAVLCRKGDAIQLSQDHRPSCKLERKRVEDLGGNIEDGYLDGELAVTRALGDWHMKFPLGSKSPLTAEPEFQWTLLSEDDEFLIIGCDGIWDVLSNQEAVSIVCCELRHHNDPQQCARELVKEALSRRTFDNVTAIVVCFSSPESGDLVPCQRPRFRLCVTEEARNKLRSSLDGC